MKRIGFLFIASLIVPAIIFSQVSVAPNINDELIVNSPMELKGWLGERLLHSMHNRIVAQNSDRLVQAFTTRNETSCWQSEFWGKWFTSAVLAVRYHPDSSLKRELEQAAQGLVNTQTKDGYIGNYATAKRLQQWDIWGRKYCMLGLLAYYDLTKNKKWLTAAARVADNLINDINASDGLIVNKGNYRGMAASSVLEPVCILYRYTGDTKYLNFAKEIVREWERPEGPQLISKSAIDVGKRFALPASWYSPEQGEKAYEMMSCYEGLLELYRITGDSSYKKAVEDTWESIRSTEINIAGSGASMEMWFGGRSLQHHPITHFQETCVSVTWLKLCLQLLRLTGETKYADEAERTYYNSLLGSMSRDGAEWAKYTPLNGQRLPGSEQCGMGINCCEASGPRGLFIFPFYMMNERKEGLQVNFFGEGTSLLHTPRKQAITISQHSGFPMNGQVNIEMNISKPEEFEITIRVPAWSRSTHFSVNGEQSREGEAGSLLRIRRMWKSGDRISVELDMRGNVVEMENPKSIAITYGPIVLARDSRFEGVDIQRVLKPVMNKDGFIDLKPMSPASDEVLMSFKASFITESYTEKAAAPVEIVLCDYLSAGNGKEKSYYKVWIDQLIDRSK